jgi:hypothetical protein
MKEHLSELGASPERIQVIPYSVDQRFFSPLREIEQEAGFVLSLGEVRSRDYPALFRAVRNLPMSMLVAASGRWY